MTTAATLLMRARDRRLLLATAESCTAGLISAAITDEPGSSDIFDRGFVTYSNAAKTEMLGVRQRRLTPTAPCPSLSPAKWPMAHWRGPRRISPLRSPASRAPAAGQKRSPRAAFASRWPDRVLRPWPKRLISGRWGAAMCVPRPWTMH